jgi:hypothetical protein
MTQNTGVFGPEGGGKGRRRPPTEVARHEAASVGHSARDAGSSHVAQTDTDQARQVISEKGRQARDLFGEAKGQAREQASTQQHRAAHQLRTVAD